MDQNLQIYLNLNPYYVYGEKETPLQIEQKQKKYFAMPFNLRLICISTEISGKIKDIAMHKYSLSLLLAKKISYLIRLVFFGELAISDFINRIAQDLQIDKKTAQNIAIDINKEIFHKVSKELKEIQRNFHNKSVISNQRPITDSQQKANDNTIKRETKTLKRDIPTPPEKLSTLEGEYDEKQDEYLEPITSNNQQSSKPLIKGNTINLKS